MSKKPHHFLTLWPWPLTYDLEKLIRSGHDHYQCVYQIWEQSIPWFLGYRVNTIAGGGRRVAGGGRLRHKTITSPDPWDTGDIINNACLSYWYIYATVPAQTWPNHMISVQKNLRAMLHGTVYLLSHSTQWCLVNHLLWNLTEACLNSSATEALFQIIQWCFDFINQPFGFP